jgi:hypothetical protein
MYPARTLHHAPACACLHHSYDEHRLVTLVKMLVNWKFALYGGVQLQRVAGTSRLHLDTSYRVSSQSSGWDVSRAITWFTCCKEWERD